MHAQAKFAAVAHREVQLADFIPYSTHVSDHVIKTREGDYLRIWRIALESRFQSHAILRELRRLLCDSLPFRECCLIGSWG